MPEPVSLISSAALTHTELLRFLQAIGATLNPDGIYDARLSRGEQHVWVYLEPQDTTYGPDELDYLAQKLGALPQTYILLDISKSQGSDRLAAECIVKFAEQWPCIVDLLDTQLRIVSAQEVKAVHATGKGVWALRRE
jgi:hypothetical protein